MNDQEIYQKIGEILWSIMPKDATVIYFTGDIYPEHYSGGARWLLKSGKIDTFSFGDMGAYEIENKICGLMSELRELDMFPEKWTHYKITLTDEGKFNTEFAYIPEEDSWVSLHMRGISDLTEEEWEKDYSQIPRELWEERVKLKNEKK
ncbi:hypothetical protein [Acinetobacter sp. Marseille-Q1623]|uniref:hypothetical protein n=1 Tax=Acinetobacter sp. Marseille-Q1623 TaxID=2697501 RepID=UPI00157A7E92|nr:hypothetical protein [Acinetobacter sp. Marseille-Q1623]